MATVNPSQQPSALLVAAYLAEGHGAEAVRSLLRRVGSYCHVPPAAPDQRYVTATRLELDSAGAIVARPYVVDRFGADSTRPE